MRPELRVDREAALPYRASPIFCSGGSGIQGGGPAAEPSKAHTSAQRIVTGIHTRTEPFKGSLIGRQRHEQSLADHRCRAGHGGGYR